MTGAGAGPPNARAAVGGESGRGEGMSRDIAELKLLILKDGALMRWLVGLPDEITRAAELSRLAWDRGLKLDLDQALEQVRFFQRMSLSEAE